VTGDARATETPWSIRHRWTGREVGVLWMTPGHTPVMFDQDLYVEEVHADDLELYRAARRPIQAQAAPEAPEPVDPDAANLTDRVDEDVEDVEDVVHAYETGERGVTEPPRDAEVGDVVHYVARGSADGRFPPVCRAALITEIVRREPVEVRNSHDQVAVSYSPPPRVGLAVLNPSGLFFHSVEMGGVEHGEAVGVREGLPADEHAVGPLCDDRWHTPGTWHHPPRRPLDDDAIAAAATRGARREARRT
jgi:hypothetical protein